MLYETLANVTHAYIYSHFIHLSKSLRCPFSFILIQVDEELY